ncbi:hypothetical protein, partial [Nannocystis pusilla]|uniref:hypothetical protein n=1 Tax=Nannocystis pusilla TaxID=889268 RepID=UPI003BF3EBEC
TDPKTAARPPIRLGVPTAIRLAVPVSDPIGRPDRDPLPRSLTAEHGDLRGYARHFARLKAVHRKVRRAKD